MNLPNRFKAPNWYKEQFSDVVYHAAGLITKNMVNSREPLSMTLSTRKDEAKFYFFGNEKPQGVIVGQYILRPTPDLLDQVSSLFDTYNSINVRTHIPNITITHDSDPVKSESPHTDSTQSVSDTDSTITVSPDFE